MRALASALTCCLALCAACAEEPPAKQAEIAVAIGDAPAVFRLVRPSVYNLDYPDFYMQETEVTNAQFKQFLIETKKTKDDTDIIEILRQRKEKNTFSTGDTLYSIEDPTAIWRVNEFPAGQEQFPVACVTLNDAADFCAWLSEKHAKAGLFRLPTWNEWMAAAYGSDRNYPWGNDWDAANVHASYGLKYTDAPKRAETVNARPKGRTPEGLYGMLGNVGEYIHANDPTQRNYFNVGARWVGGGFTARRDDLDVNKTGRIEPRKRYWGYSHSALLRECNLGFRVLLDPSKDLDLIQRPRLFERNTGGK